MAEFTNKEILAFSMAGMRQLTFHCLPVDSAYEIYKFKDRVNKITEEIHNHERALLVAVGIDNAEDFDKKFEKLSKGKKKSEKYIEMKKLRELFFAMRQKILDEKVEIDVKPLPYEEWKKLQDENHKDGRDPLSGFAENALEGKLWTAPKDTEEDD